MTTANPGRRSSVRNLDYFKNFKNGKDIDVYYGQPNFRTALHYKTLEELDIYEPHEHITEKEDKDFFEIVLEKTDQCESLIKKTIPEIYDLLDGAYQSIVSNNPDKIRHAITSLRELFTQILHRFAPDTEIQKVLSEPKWYHNGNPTRKARLAFIFLQKQGNDLLVEFNNKKIDGILSFLDLFQKGTHKIKLEITEQQLRLIFLEAKLLIQQLLL